MTKIGKCILTAILGCLCLTSTGVAELDSGVDSRDPLPAKVWSDIRVSVGDAGALAASPLHWDWNSALVAAGAAGVFCGALALDNRVRDFEQSHRSAAADHALLPWRYYGQDIIPIGGAGALYLAGLGFSNVWLCETGRRAGAALAATFFITECTKIVAGRARPFTGKGPHDLGWFQTSDDSWSFPSGHTATAFALSSVLATRIDNPYASILLYGAAAMTATARVYGDQHWISDAVAGAVIGTAVGHFIGTRQEGRLRLSLEPVIGDGAVGVGLTGRIRG